ncbi:MAG: hypothetical protein ACI9US_004388, partial [Gammaproteobacteria bacterium]
AHTLAIHVSPYGPDYVHSLLSTRKNLLRHAGLTVK